MILGEIVGWDALIVLAVVALLFGGSKVPQLARSLGSAKGEFERGLKESSGARTPGTTEPEEAPPAG